MQEPEEAPQDSAGGAETPPQVTEFHFDLHDQSLPYCRVFMRQQRRLLEKLEQLKQDNLVFSKIVRELGRAHKLQRWPVEFPVKDVPLTHEVMIEILRDFESEGYRIHHTIRDTERWIVVTIN